jgi:hypothetical protein
MQLTLYICVSVLTALYPIVGPDTRNQNGNSGRGGRLMRTVFLPTVNTDSLMLRLEALQAQLADQAWSSLHYSWLGLTDLFSNWTCCNYLERFTVA